MQLCSPGMAGKFQAAFPAPTKSQETSVPLGNNGSSSGWESKLLLCCHLEDLSGKGKGFGKLWGEFVFVEFFGEVFLSLWIFLSFLESSSSGFLIRDLGPAQIRGRCFLPIPESWKIQPGAGKTQPGMAKGKSNHRKEGKSFPDFGKVPFGNSSWGGKSYQK